MTKNKPIRLHTKEDLISIHHYRVKKTGVTQADKYFDSFFEYFDIMAKRPFSFESVGFIKEGYRHCVWGSDGIYYKINNIIVEIMAIVGKQDLNNILLIFGENTVANYSPIIAAKMIRNPAEN